VQALRAADAKQLTRVYFHFYPLFQQAYENLGYPSQYFNDRLIEVIDDMLKAPDVQGPIELIQPRSSTSTRTAIWRRVPQGRSF